ncbi:hypothetical protein PFUGPA_05226 [Plasmodium falciparum Palo Alto/Uganda]|uniref:Fe-S cluster assembly protein n=1 Tax=Plasmodium falciparum (isolate Palo Alto / Uganda) TaxID=57270 RepID=W4IT05_PLAFP|nr:hypothetical protein PFUGPA_05226 [Plasmodium falciparum Palo Alto/Uganda]
MDSDLIDEEFVYGQKIGKIKKKKELILDTLKSVIDPDLKKNIVELNFVRNLKINEDEKGEKYFVEFDLNLTTPACPVKDDLLRECKEKLGLFEWIHDININITFINFNEKRGNNKNKIENIILIYSCKGGVGKSFFSVNFSYYLKKKGASVGILDADINGPSLPTLLPFDYEYVKFKVVNKKKDEPTKGKNGYIYNDDMNNNNNDDVDNNDMNNNIDNNNIDNNNIDNNNIHNNNIHNNNLHNNNLHNNLHNNLQNSDGKNTFCGEKKKKNSFTHEKYFITQYDNEPKDDDDDFFFNLSLEKRKEKKKKKKPNRENLLNIFNSKNYNKLSNDDKKNSGTIEYDENLSMIEPLIYNDVKLMSYAYIKNKMNLGFSSFRGPILNELIKEFLYHVNWGILDYLIIDMPPGTNDIHLNLFESEKIDGIIMITTPNDLSTNDVEKGINMCNFFNIPIVCLVINMNYFICDNCDKKHYIFNNTDMKSLKDKIRNIYEIPFHPILAKNVYTHKHNYKKDTTNVLSIQDANIKHNEYTQQKMEHISEEHIKHFPFILAYDKNHFLIEHLENLFQQIVREIAILKYNHNLNIPNLQIYKKNYLQLSFDTIQNKYVFSDDVLICHIKDIRRKCKCLICKENKKEKKCIQYDKNNNHNNYNFKKKISLFPPNIYVKDIIPLGIYNVKIVWSDNHSSIYSYVYLKHLFEKKRINNNNLFCKTNNSGMYEW